MARLGPDRFRLQLSAGEAEVLVDLVEQLRSLVLQNPDDPALDRLFPPAYTDDDEREAEYQRLMRDELLQARMGAMDAVAASAQADELTEEQLSAWMRSINDLRLVLGVRLEITEDADAEEERFDRDDPTGQLYLYLGVLLEDVVAALSDA